MRISRDRNADARVRGGLGLAWRRNEGHKKYDFFVSNHINYTVWILLGPYRWRLKWRR